MQSGFNENIKYKGVVLHVQTEDLGPDKAKLETTVFSSGQALLHHQEPYPIESDLDLEEFIREHHRSMTSKLVEGQFDPEIIPLLSTSNDSPLPSDQETNAASPKLPPPTPIKRKKTNETKTPSPETLSEEIVAEKIERMLDPKIEVSLPDQSMSLQSALEDMLEIKEKS